MRTATDDLTENDEKSFFDPLRDCISAVGVDRFLTRALSLPSEKHFPDRWEPTGLGVGRLAKRLLWLAGMPPEIASG